MAKKLGGTAQFLNEVFTVQGGKKNYEQGLEAKGALIGIVVAYTAVNAVKLISSGVYLAKRAKKSKKGE